MIFRPLLAVLYPQRCVCCGKFINEGEWLCEKCSSDIEYIKAEKRCKRCGLEKSHCTCKSRVYYFENVLCVFENTGLAQKALYRYKLGKHIQYSEFFAQRMAIAVKCEYAGIKFDAVCCVPTGKKSLMKNGFDHSVQLCKCLAKFMKLEMLEDVLFCRKTKLSQHESSFKERFENVKNKYGTNYRLDGKTVLLTDDIKTSGATLNACARQLLFAGAKRVYCVTVLGTVPETKPKEK